MDKNGMKGCCPGSATQDFRAAAGEKEQDGKRQSHLRQWPVQLHLVSPRAPYFEKADLLLSADCAAYAAGDFHKDFLEGKSLAIGCPKLDDGQDIYVEKIRSLIDDAKINTLTVVIMQVPCCGGLEAIAREAAGRAERKIPLKTVVLNLQGDVLSEDWCS